MKFSVVIPTYRREEDLKRCLSSVLSQDVLPTECVLIDDDAISVDLLDDIQMMANDHEVELVYVKKSDTQKQRGSSQSRNLGLNRVSTTVMVVLDDDIELEQGFFASMVSTWVNDPSLLGVGGVITNNRSISVLDRLYRMMFGLGSKLAWDVNTVGYQVWDDGVKLVSKGHYAHGGLFAYDVAKLKQLGGFTEFSEGRNALEDVDFFLRAKQTSYYTLVDPMMRAYHAHSSTSRESAYQTGFRETANRIAIFRKYMGAGFTRRLWFEWATMGWILRQVLAGHVRKAYGMFAALWRV
ncbi:MAG: glycosyltransferase family 2 protein [bacterium]|jgi:GT2 family glycosyltransferase|nr:glycosyltransferase family 2 protein [bacterium]